MDDSKDLYFLPILARAHACKDPERAMREAFDEILKLGKNHQYERGFRQFQEFVKESFQPSGKDHRDVRLAVRDVIYRVMYDLATDTFEGSEEQRRSLLSTFKDNAEWNAEYERIKQEAHDVSPPQMSLEIDVLKEGRIVGSFPFSKTPMTIGAISMGSYIVRLSTGRILWEGDIAREEVLWTYAFPGKELTMAAETELSEQPATRTIPLLDGEFVMRVFPGLESGTIRIERGYDTT
jgi:hypothetical protein